MFLIKTLSSGSIFGVEALNDTLRKTRAVAETETVCFTLNKNECFALFTPTDIKKLNSSYLIVPKPEEMTEKVKLNISSRTKRVLNN